jgi:hypothetical protein
MGVEFPGITDQVIPCRDSNAVRVSFLRSEIDDNVRICHQLIFGDVGVVHA